MTTTCADLGDRLAAAVTDDGALDREARAHVETCLRCQADLVEHRRVLRALRSLRTEVLVPAPGLVTEVLAHIEEAGERRAIRSLLTGRRVAYLGGLAAATAAAGAAGALVLATRGRGRRLPLAG
ncbi:hypothetical protein PO878_19550 [Iamia majanohamensis]|uniref:Zinc-finger domain-containing protein n=1 Tax=Iamia majanohamensis TaxID=467976 RepID=A0AAE9Y8Z6_9ACTN|nr:hypothetical protein [Iamia majanohamensis]WCO66693.1 hypothetical protein PO878_19550 [Iamia majanohamensis]